MGKLGAAVAAIFILLSGPGWAAAERRAGDPQAAAGDVAAAVAAARAYRAENGARIIRQFADFLSLPNNAADAADIARNAEAIIEAFGKRGFAMARLDQDGAAPLVYGERAASGAARTIAIYVHYDGQPTNAARWTHPPFAPTLYDGAMREGGQPIPLPEPGAKIDDNWRLYARSASDDKAPLPALLAAIDALDAAEIPFTSNIKLIFDGEEEAGSDHLGAYLDRLGDWVDDIDLWLFCDGPNHQSGAKQLVYGVRGVTGMEITVYGPNRGLHSGHYGNWAPDPGMMLARLLGSMEDGNGRVLIEDFYKDTAPISAADRAAIAAAPAVDEDLRALFGLAETEAGNAPLAERILLPSLTIRGLASGGVGGDARNQITPSARASLEMRLAKGDDPEAMKDRVEAHIRARGYHIVRAEPDAATRRAHAKIAKVTRQSGYPAMRTPIGATGTAELVAAARTAAPDLIEIPTLGGSLPLYMFEARSDAPIVIMPIANYDNNQHAPDENIRIGNLWYGVDVYAAMLAMARAETR